MPKLSKYAMLVQEIFQIKTMGDYFLVKKKVDSLIREGVGDDVKRRLQNMLTFHLHRIKRP